MSAKRRCIAAVCILGCATFLEAGTVNLPEIFAIYGGSQGTSEAFFGRSIAGVGDQNGDGYADVLIANNFEKKAFLFLGGSPMDTLPARVYQRGESGFASEVANLGDVNDDGKSDFAIASGSGIFVYRGGSIDTVPMLLLPGTYAHVTGVGDVNGDGFADVLVSDPLWNASQGRARLFFGGNPMDTIPDWTATGDSAKRWFGFSITGNGDLNHDGYKDFAIAEFRVLAADTPAKINVYLGGTTVDTLPRLVIDGSVLHGLVWSVCIVSDLNGDHYDELAAPSKADTGAFVFFGRDTLKSTPDIVLQGSGFSSPMDLRIASAGDVNGDGYNDILTGNQSAVNGLGEVLLYLGKPQMTGKPDFVTRGYYGSWEGAGREVAWCGDVNHDGLDDLMFSCYAPLFLTQHGKVEIFAGSHGLVVGVNDRKLPAGPPSELVIEPNYPNPFNPSTQIRYALPWAGSVGFQVFDILGRVVATISGSFQQAGYHDITWDAGSLASGIYYIRLSLTDESGQRTAPKVLKCVLAK